MALLSGTPNLLSILETPMHCHSPEVIWISAAVLLFSPHVSVTFQVPNVIVVMAGRQLPDMLTLLTVVNCLFYFNYLVLSQASDARQRGLMDMMGGVLEVKKEDILRMVSYLAIFGENEMR